ncbi:MAG: alpha/beta hydrolase [Flavobacteriales bacterium]|nr:alpha/beta hydrolase [Flavobacteriales bacterium]
MAKNPTPSPKENEVPFLLRLIRLGIRVLDLVFPKAAGLWAYKLFFKPRPSPYSSTDLKWLGEFKNLEVLTLHTKVVVYQKGEAPYVLFAHGWSGKATQFRELAEAVHSAGFGILLMDMPGHGQSAGMQTDALEFANALEAAVAKFEVLCAVTHSLSGMSLAWSLSEDAIRLKKWVLINTPSIPKEIVEKFIKLIGGGYRTRERFVNRVQQRYNISFNEFAVPELLRNVDVLPKMLVFHDANDQQVSIRNAELLAKELGLGFIETRGLGHNRILRSDVVIEKVLEFLNEPDQSSSSLKK